MIGGRRNAGVFVASVGGQAKKSVMKRIPVAFWILLPLVLGLGYYVAYPLFESEPTHATMAPQDAVLVERFRDFDTFDRDWYFQLGAEAPSPSAVVATENNVPRLPGVDRSRPIYIAKMPPSRVGTDPTVILFPIADHGTFSEAFNDPEMLEKGRIRRAKHMQKHGSWVAVGASRSAVRTAGQGSLFAEDRGEDYSIAASVPGLAQTAAASPGSVPWRGVLQALNVTDPMMWRRDGDGVGWSVVMPSSPQLRRILSSWTELRMWSWRTEQRIELELTALAGSPAGQALAEAMQGAAAAATGPQFRDARMWAQVPTGAFPALREALLALGVQLPAGLAKATPAGPVSMLATRSTGHPYAVSYALAAPEEAGIDWTEIVGPLPDAGDTRPLAAGDAPLTLLSKGQGRKPPAGVVSYMRHGGEDIVSVGTSAPTAGTRMQAFRSGASEPGPEVAATVDGWRLLLAFGLDEQRAIRVLGPAVGERGLFAALKGTAVLGEVRTNGTTLRVVLRAAP